MDWVRTMRRCSMCQASAVPESTPVFQSAQACCLSSLSKMFSATTCLPDCLFLGTKLKCDDPVDLHKMHTCTSYYVHACTLTWHVVCRAALSHACLHCMCMLFMYDLRGPCSFSPPCRRIRYRMMPAWSGKPVADLPSALPPVAYFA